MTLSDGREFNGIVYSADPISDLAVVKVTDLTEMLPAAKLGSSKKMRTGDWVVALGCPFGFRNSVSAGIISGWQILHFFLLLLFWLTKRSIEHPEIIR